MGRGRAALLVTGWPAFLVMGGYKVLGKMSLWGRGNMWGAKGSAGAGTTESRVRFTHPTTALMDSAGLCCCSWSEVVRTHPGFLSFIFLS